ncbi:two-partner secretion domain-containing protein [Falsiroseomonas stagni]|uniref:Filamentous hemagglutinin family N-terminal domain-containing protein n=1 Tax=Falsiroseomonas stagni DSM 19981 TaxID=1123062 RepID=A0A1I4A8W3_9PROT|nr:filamentous hemagglutinin N-terminal domain-containing protein [Falsiroseomonas stagni]SFK52620.1 filamentous hemagglutinin family N-terminal domain-containing protein [Falsiroseomonas stagni DSM 19981]
MARHPPLFRFAIALTLAPLPGWAQALDARPSGGQVVAGQASISQTAARTQVNQATDRAVIEWQRFDVGAQHQVDIRQPSASSFSLQRVTGGDPSAIAGRVTSNGGVALVNPAGVVFSQGAQVDVAALIATTSDITNQNFMAGRMVFDGQPRPGTRVENRGTVTVADRGLAALVAPSVANSGTIRARLGRVALAGGEAFALDLAGDGLLALDVTRQVQAAPGGATALVTQSGTIEAAGGSVLLSASAASGVIETLVQAGGTTTASQVALRAQGGGVTITGDVTAPRGVVEATASGTVRVAAGARVSADGGRVAIGAGAESRPGAPRRLASRTVVEPGARVSADGGGSILVHGQDRTEMRGSLSATGGEIEVSSRNALALDGAMAADRVLVDPVTLRVVTTLSGTTEPAEITAAAINATAGALTLQAEAAITVEAAINKPSGPLTLETTNATATTGQGITILRPVTVAGDLVLRSAGDITQAGVTALLNVGTLEARSSGGQVRLEAAGNAIRALAGGAAATRFGIATTTALSVDGAIVAPELALATNRALALQAPLTATTSLDLNADGGVTQDAAGAGITTGLLRLQAPNGAVALTGAGNQVTTLGDATVPLGLSLVNEGALNIAGTINGGRLSFTTLTGDLTQDPAASRLIADELQAVAEAGSVLFDGTLNSIPLLYGRARDSFIVDAGGAVLLAAPVTATDVEIRAAGEIAQDLGATITATRLRLNATGGAITFDDPLNQVAALGDAAAGGAFVLATGGALSVAGTVSGTSVTLTAGGDITTQGGRIETPLLRVTAIGGQVRLDAGDNAIAALGSSGAATDFTLVNRDPLRVAGAVDAGGTLRLTAQDLAVEAPLAAALVVLRAESGDVTQTASGGITAPRLLAESPLGNVRLATASNGIGAFGGLAGFEWEVAAAGSAAPDATAGIAAPQVRITVGGDLVQAAGAAAIDAERITATAAGRVDLRAAANAIRELGAITAPGGLFLSTTTDLTLALPLTLPSATLSAAQGITQLTGAPLAAGVARLDGGTGDVLLPEGANAIPRLAAGQAGGVFRLSTSGSLAIEGAVSAGTRIEFQAGGDITQSGTGAGLVAPLLGVVSLGGNVALTGAGNRVPALGYSAAAGDFALSQEGASPLLLTGLLVAPSATLRTEGGVADAAGGGLRAGMLVLDTTGAVRLDAAGQHLLDAVAGRAGSLALAVEGALSVADPLAVTGVASLSATALSLDSRLSAASAGLVARAGSVTQAATGAGITTGSLSVQASGAVTLEGAGNAVTRLAAGSAGGAFTLASTGALAIAGGVSGSDIVLRAGGTLTLDGASLAADRAVLLAVPGGLASGTTSRLLARDPTALPVMIVDTRRTGGLVAIPAGVAADLPGLPAAAQATQLSTFGAPAAAAAGPAVFDLVVGSSPLFLLLDGGSAVGVLEAGRLGLLGSGGSAFIVGTLGGAGGGTAAQSVAVASAGSTYLFNSCVMGATLCGGQPVTPDQPDPVTPPVVTPDPPPVVVPVLPGGGTTLAGLPLLPGSDIAPRLLATDLRAGSPDGPPEWLLLSPWRREEDP